MLASLCLLRAPLLDLDQRINARFGNEQVLAVHLQHHKPILVERDQTPPLGLRLSPSIGVHHQVCPAQHVRPSPSPAHHGRRDSRALVFSSCVVPSSDFRVSPPPLCNLRVMTGVPTFRKGPPNIHPCALHEFFK